MHIVDRRLNPSGKNLANRQRFMRRAKSLIRKAVHESSASRSIKDADEGGEVVAAGAGRAGAVVPPRRVQAACATTCCRATRSTWRAIPSRARPAARGGGGSEGSPDGEGEDDFRFALSRDEFVDLFLEDLELPDLAKRKVVDAESAELAPRRLFGHRLAGQPRADAHRAQQPVAAHRAEAAEARGDRRRCATRSPRLAMTRTTSDAARCALEAELAAQAAPHAA